MLPSFDLQSHDSARDDPNPIPEVVTTVKWNGRSFALGWAESYKGMVTARTLAFQETNGPLWRAVVDSHYPDFPWMTAGEFGFNTNEELRVVREAFKKTMQEGLMTRLLFLNDQTRLREKGELARYAVLLTQQGWGEWRSLRHASERRVFSRGEAGFWCACPDDGAFSDAAGVNLWESLRPQLDVPDAPLHFAHRFADTPRMERFALLWQWKRGNQRELEATLRSLFLSQTKWWQTPRYIEWRINLKERSETRIPRDGEPKPRRTPSLGKALQQVWDWFDPTVDFEAQTRHLELKRLYEGERHIFSLVGRQPTMHEQLEAALSWREWLASVQEHE